MMSDPQLAVEPLLRQALARHQAGRFAEAAPLYERVLALRPDFAEVHGNLGGARKALGDVAGALECYRRAIALKPDYAVAHYNLANLLKDMGDAAGAMAHYRQAAAARPGLADAHNNLGTLLLEGGLAAEAAQSYRRALTARPVFAEARNNLGNALKALGQTDEALRCYEAALAQKPDFAEAHNNKGVALLERDRPADAAACFRRALALRPGYAEAHNNLGNALMHSDPEAAIAEYSRAVAADPHYVEAHHHLGVALCERHRIADGFAAFTRGAELAYRDTAPPQSPPLHKLRHDEQQRAYLSRRGIAADIDGPLHLDGGDAIAGGTIRARDRAGEIERQWAGAKPQILVVDDFLTDAALAALRRFCLASTVWRVTFEDGYLGARPESGFACPLLAQIAEELRQSFPAIFRDHPLLYAWAFKYDQALKGTQIHADFAAVNVNFWITPDEANDDPQTGGLRVWDTAAPLDWDFKHYNRDEPAIRDFLARSNAASIRIPHRANRAVIFDSDLFHETDRMRFRGGYENRRINITLLYGRRGG